MSKYILKQAKRKWRREVCRGRRTCPLFSFHTGSYRLPFVQIESRGSETTDRQKLAQLPLPQQVGDNSPTWGEPCFCISQTLSQMLHWEDPGGWLGAINTSIYLIKNPVAYKVRRLAARGETPRGTTGAIPGFLSLQGAVSLSPFVGGRG